MALKGPLAGARLVALETQATALADRQISERAAAIRALEGIARRTLCTSRRQTSSVPHPDGHDVASQAHLPCALHTCFAAHVAQTPPPRPHAVFDGVALHTPLAQHPAHEAPPQVHAPPLQL